MGETFITKHCTPAVREMLIKGHFKIGTLHEYRNSEGGGLLSDFREGLGNIGVKTFSGSFTINLPDDVQLIDCKAENAGGNALNIHFDHHNIPVFCASRGLYDHRRHRRILDGEGDYAANPGCTSFVIIDAQKFGRAMAAMSAEVIFQRSMVYERAIEYRSREELVHESEAQRALGPEQQELFYRKLPFFKPVKFSLEEEVRFAVPLPKGHFSQVEPTFSAMFPNRIQRLFRNAIVDQGSDVPRC